MKAVPANYESVIFDPYCGEKKTINGMPAGYLSPSYPRLVGSDGKPQAIDVAEIVDYFHEAKAGDPTLCVYTGAPAEGVNVVDGNPNNFLITNLEPVSQAWMEAVPFLPKTHLKKVFIGTEDLEVEVYGAPIFRAAETLDKLILPEIPAELGLAHVEAELMWIWNQLTKVKLLKGLASLTRRNRQTGVSVSLTNKSVLEYTFKLLHHDFNTGGNNA